MSIPSLEEQRLAGARATASHVETMRRQLATARTELLDIATAPDIDLPPSLSAAISKLLARPAPSPQVDPAPRGRDGWPTLDDVDAWDADVDEAERFLEPALDETRALLSRAISFRDSAPDSKTARWRDVERSDLNRRRADRDHLLAKLRHLLEGADDEDEDRRTLILDRIAQVEALSDQDLMTDPQPLLRLGDVGD